MNNKICFHTFGDSHAREPWNNIPKNYNIKINHIGALLCYSFGNEVLNRINISDPKYNVKEDDYVCFSLGEIDCRCHVHKHIDSHKKKKYKTIINELVENYMKAININKSKFKNINICVLSLPPIIDKNFIEENKKFPFLGTNGQRRAYICFFNEQLKLKCIENNFIFLNIYKYYLDENKFLKEELRGKNVHIGDPKYLLQVMNKFNILQKIKIE